MREVVDDVLFVGGLSEEINEEMLYDMFAAFGDITNIDMPKNVSTNKHRGFAFIEYVDKEDIKHALYNMNNAELFGKRIHCNYSKTKKSDRYKALWMNESYYQDSLQMLEQNIDNINKEPSEFEKENKSLDTTDKKDD